MLHDDDAHAYLAHIAVVRVALSSVAEDMATGDLGGSQELMRTALPPGQPPMRARHQLDGEHGLGLSAEQEAEASNLRAIASRPKAHSNSADDSAPDTDSDGEGDDDDHE